MSNCSFAQVLTLNNLIEKSKCNTYDCFNPFILKKGFHLKTDTIFPLYRSYIYISDKKYTVADGSNQATVSLYKDNSEVTVAFATESKSLYMAYLDSLTKTDFKSVELEPENNDGVMKHTTYYDRSLKYPELSILLTVLTFEVNSEEHNFYNISVSRKKKR